MESVFVPRINYNEEIARDPNIFRSRFGSLPTDEWQALMLRSSEARLLDGVEFPLFPDQGLQQSMHGSSTLANAISEAFLFYEYVQDKAKFNLDRTRTFLDFGCGWGRMTRPFMRDFDLNCMYGFEPNLLYATIARSLNPYVCVLSGDYLPDGTIPSNRFDLIIGWSIFSHLSQQSSRQWLSALATSLRPGGICALTTWGTRFLERLRVEQEMLRRGEAIHHYSETQIKKAGDLTECIARYRAGEFLFFGAQKDLYGTTFLSRAALQKIIDSENLALEIEFYDDASLAQDVFGLRKIS